MAKRTSNLDNRVAQQLGRGKSTTQVINAIRASKGGKNINIRYIKDAIARWQASQASAAKLSGLKPGDSLSKTLSNRNKGGGRTVRVAFKFQFDFSGGGSKSKGGRQSVYLTADLPASMTKAEMSRALQQIAQDWIEEHYSSDPEGRSSVRITIFSIKGL